MDLEDWGYDAFFAQALATLPEDFEPARVIFSSSGICSVVTAGGSETARASGRLLHGAQSALELPAVGDWVALRRGDESDSRLVTHVLPRKTCLVRKMAGRTSDAQVLAANVDTLVIVSAADHELNVRRVERFLEAVVESGARPVLVLNKIDLTDEWPAMVDKLRQVAPTLPILPVSAQRDEGLSALDEYLIARQTISFIGSSGVGKSAIINRLRGDDAQREGAVREHDHRGRHTTTFRAIFPLPSGALLMDTPGLRELGLFNADKAPLVTFEDIATLAAECRYRDCQHRDEPGCAVLAAVVSGTLDAERLEAWRKLEAERKNFLERHDVRERLQAKRASIRLRRAQRKLQKSSGK